MKTQSKAPLLSLVLSALTVLTLSGCSSPEPNKVKEGTQGAQSFQLKPVTIAQYGHLLLYIPLYVAKDRGYFKDAGLDVNIVSTGGDEKTFTAVTTGNAQFGVADPTFTAIARQRGQGGQVVAQVVNGVPFWGVAFKDSIKPLKNITEATGLRIATFPAPSTCYTVMKNLLLDNNGHPVKGASIVQGTATGGIVALTKAGMADVAIELEPTVSIACAHGGHVVLSLQKEFGDFAITGLTVSDAYRKSDPETIEAVVRALYRAMRYIDSDYEGTVKIAMQEFPEIDEKLLRQALTRMISEGTIPKSPEMERASWDKAIKLRRQTGDLKGDDEHCYENLDMSFAQKVTAEKAPPP